MSGSPGISWSDDPNAPKVPYSVYLEEKANFGGVLIGAIFYGIVIVLFFQCMGALLNPIKPTTGGIKWVLVVHTVSMFSIVTIFTAITLNEQFVSYIHGREFPGDGVLPPGPLGYGDPRFKTVVGSIMFFLNHWLADGLLLYRCYVIYAKSYWIIAFPCLTYLSSLAMGLMVIYRLSQPEATLASISSFGLPFYSISFSLNVLLTVMIVTRLIIHSRKIRNAMGIVAGSGRLYTLVITMLVESCALYAIAFVLLIGPWGFSNHVDNVVFPLLAEVQVVAPFLIILRVANRSAFASDPAVSEDTGTIHFRSPEKSTGVDESPPRRSPAGSAELIRGTSSGLNAEGGAAAVPHHGY